MDGQCLVSIFKRLGFEIALYHGDVSLEEGKSHIMFEGKYCLTLRRPVCRAQQFRFFFAKLLCSKFELQTTVLRQSDLYKKEN